jgi:hypothetical protein
MLNVVCTWPDGQWALVLGIIRAEFDGIWMGKVCACPVRRPGHGIVAAPIMLVVIREEDFESPGYFDALSDRVREQFPEEDTIVPVVLSEDGRMALEDGKRLQFESNKAFGAVAPTGWKNCRYIELRAAENEEQFIASLEGRTIVDER